MAGLNRNGWQLYAGIGGRFSPESLAGMGRNTHVTPSQRKSGEYKEIFERRNATMEYARLAHPERWGNRIRVWKASEEIYLNPSDETKERLNQKNAA